MKNLKYIVAALVLSFSLTACTSTIPPEDTSLPSLDIVQRSELLDMVNIDCILSQDTKQLLADCGVSVSMQDFALTADDMARFTLTFTTAYGDYSYKFNSVISYMVTDDGSFGDIRLYWGGISAAQDSLLITSLYDYAVLPLNTKPENFTPHYLSFVKDKGGCIVHSRAGFDRYAFMYRTLDEEGVAVFDSKGRMVSHRSAPQVDTGIVGLFGTQTQALVSDVPFSYENQFSGQFISENLFMINFTGWASPVCRLYSIADNTMTDLAFSYADALSADGAEYSVYQIFNSDGWDKSVGYGILALRKENGSYTGAVLSDTKGYVFEKQSFGPLSLKDGRLVFHGQPVGVQFTMDFETGSCEKQYLITTEMLGEKIAVSKDKNYSLYEYGIHPHNNMNISYLALKNEKTGEISFVSEYRGAPYVGFTLDAGFFSNGDIYLLTDYDFKIFNADTVEKGYIFSVGEKFPLGITKDDGYKYNTLHAARRDPDDGSFIVVYDHLSNARNYDGPFDEKDGSLFADTYEVSLLDPAGNIVKTYRTKMPVPYGNYPLNMYLTGNLLTLQNINGESGKILQKATLDIKTGKFTLVQKWTAGQS